MLDILLIVELRVLLNCAGAEVPQELSLAPSKIGESPRRAHDPGLHAHGSS